MLSTTTSRTTSFSVLIAGCQCHCWRGCCCCFRPIRSLVPSHPLVDFWFFPFSVDWNRLPLNRENRYMQNPKQQRRREGKRDIATSCCVFICTFFPFTLLFSNFLSWHLGLIPFWARDKKKFCIWIYILYMTIWTLKCSYSNSFVCLSWVKASLTLSFIQTLSRTVCGGDWWVNWE